MGAPESGLTGINSPGKGAGRLEQAPRPRADTASPLVRRAAREASGQPHH